MRTGFFCELIRLISTVLSGINRVISWSIAHWAFQAYNPNCWSSSRFY